MLISSDYSSFLNADSVPTLPSIYLQHLNIYRLLVWLQTEQSQSVAYQRRSETTVGTFRTSTLNRYKRKVKGIVPSKLFTT